LNFVAMGMIAGRQAEAREKIIAFLQDKYEK
jgi:hypothetical protein